VQSCQSHKGKVALLDAQVNASDVSERALVSPPRVQRGVNDHPTRGERFISLIVWIRVRSLLNAWSAVCLALICRSMHGDHYGGCRLAR
jgi:hypothetical protein